MGWNGPRVFQGEGTRSGGPRQAASPLGNVTSVLAWGRGRGGQGYSARPSSGPDHAWERLGSWWRRAGGRSSLRAGPPRAPGERTPSPEQGAAHPRHGAPGRATHLLGTGLATRREHAGKTLSASPGAAPKTPVCLAVLSFPGASCPPGPPSFT